MGVPQKKSKRKFQSTLLMRGATNVSPHGFQSRLFQSTLLMRGATGGHGRFKVLSIISIHAPHARSDKPCKNGMPGKQFQSTLLMRGATLHRCIQISGDYFNPRSSCEERLALHILYFGTQWISIHAPQARSDEVKV